MTWLLHIETATALCGVALGKDGKLVSQRVHTEGLNHAENLHVFIQDCLKEADIAPSDLSAISVSNGPGSYTGLRIGVSAAKGLAYTLQIPLITLPTLAILCENATVKYDLKTNSLLCPMFDARRMEIYTALYTDNTALIKPAEAVIVDETWVRTFDTEQVTYFFGDGMPKCKELLSCLPNAIFLEAVIPLPEQALRLAFSRHQSKTFADVAYAEPDYLKPYFFAKKH